MASPSHLRSKLQYVCDDLQNLITADIEDCKWPIKKRIFLSLLSRVPSLEEYCIELEKVEKNRNQELALYRSADISREKRMDNEHRYRNKFMQVILDACTHLKWPPAFEAFTDVLGILLNDKDVVLNAIQYILEVGIPSTHSNNNNPNYNRHQKSPVSAMMTESPRIFHSPQMLPITESKNRNISMRSPTNDITNRMEGMYVVEESSLASGTYSPDYDALARAFKILQHHNEELSKQLRTIQEAVCLRNEVESKFEMLLQDFKQALDEIDSIGTGIGRNKTSTQVPFPSSSTTSIPVSVSVSVSLPGHVSEKEMAMYEEEVRREKQSQGQSQGQGKGLTSSKQRRGRLNDDTATATSTTTQGDSSQSRLRSRSAQKTTTSSNSTNTTGTSAASTHSTRRKSDSTTTSIKPESIPPSSAYGTSSTTSSSSAAAMAMSSTPIVWSKLRSQVTSIQNQWLAARRDAVDAVWGKITLLPEESDVTESFLSEGKRSQSQSNRNKGSVSGSGCGTGIGGQGGMVKDPGDILIHRVLGIHTSSKLLPSTHANVIGGSGRGITNDQLAMMTAAVAHGITSNGAGIDLSRIHQLQRLLIDFVASAATICDLNYNNIPLNSDSSRNHNNSSDESIFHISSHTNSDTNTDSNSQWPLSHSSFKFVAGLENLRERVGDLQLSLACLAPVAVLECEDPVLKSHCTGLEILVKEAMSAAQLSKTSNATTTATISRIEHAADRAKKEQLALAMEVRSLRRRLQTWVTAAGHLLPRLDAFGSSVESTLRDTVDDMKSLSTAATVIVESVRVAESARVALVSGSAPVSPLDALARGSMGSEIASLVLALQMHMDELRTGSIRLNDVHGRLVTSLKGEMTSLRSTATEIRVGKATEEQRLQGGTIKPGGGEAGSDTSGVKDPSSSHCRSKKPSSTSGKTSKQQINSTKVSPRS
eukprot:gene9326-19355_t